jgi:catechol 2,3-dioxygenase-like lactoylglutathione lyase family enzyme
VGKGAPSRRAHHNGFECGYVVGTPRTSIRAPAALPTLRIQCEERGRMSQQAAKMAGAATVLIVSDIVRSVAYYRDILGFAVTFEYGTPLFYACLCRDEVALHLLAAHRTGRLPGDGGICVFVDDVDRIHAELAARGARVLKPPQDYDYGMRDFDVVDPDGNQLTFGMATDKPL